MSRDSSRLAAWDHQTDPPDVNMEIEATRAAAAAGGYKGDGQVGEGGGRNRLILTAHRVPLCRVK